MFQDSRLHYYLHSFLITGILRGSPIRGDGVAAPSEVVQVSQGLVRVSEGQIRGELTGGIRRDVGSVPYRDPPGTNGGHS